jgi:hypothetical protein
MASRGERATREEHRWPAAVGILTAMVLYLSLPGPFLPGLRYAVVVLGLVLLVPLIVVNPVRFQRQTRWSRNLSITEAVLLAGANQVALVQLVNHLVHPGGLTGQRLLLAALQVWVTNVIVFALVFWEIDRGGPVARSRGPSVSGHSPDLHFVQDEAARVAVSAVPSSSMRRWRPDFLDYLFTSLWTSTAFSPTDAIPLSHRAKAIMALESISGLVVFALVVSRSVNIFT